MSGANAIIGLSLIVSAPYLIGGSIVLGFGLSRWWVERVGLLYLVGVAVICLGITVLGIAGLPLRAVVLVPLLVVTVAVLSWFGQTGLRLVARDRPLIPDFSRATWILIALTALNVAT